MQLKWIGKGTEKSPITIEALNPGKVKIEGGSILRIAGEWLSVSGLHFTDGYAPKGSVIEFRNGQELANHCRLTNCVIDKFNPSRRDQAYSYILLYGRHNRVDHCSLTGKLNLGVTLIVILNDERCLENHHRIDHNYFGERPVYGSNGAETMRVGTSQQAYSSSNTVIENNLFERCSGEVEVISIKSSDNIIRNNTLLECEGVVALRHGDRNTVNITCLSVTDVVIPAVSVSSMPDIRFTIMYWSAWQVPVSSQLWELWMPYPIRYLIDIVKLLMSRCTVTHS